MDIWLLAILYINFITKRIGKLNQQGGIIMSEKKFNGIWRKVKDGINFAIDFIPIVLMVVLLTTGILLIGAIINGAIISVCWNVAMTTMFNLQNITIFQAFVLAFTIGCLRSNYLSNAKSEYEKLKKKISDKINKEKIAKIVSVIIIMVLELISILIAVWVVMYSWNNILPQLLNMELIQINFGQAFACACLFNLVFGVPEFDYKKSKDEEKNENKKRPKMEDEAKIETIEAED